MLHQVLSRNGQGKFPTCIFDFNPPISVDRFLLSRPICNVCMKFRHNDIIHKLIISSIQIYYENHRMYHQGNQFDLF